MSYGKTTQKEQSPQVGPARDESREENAQLRLEHLWFEPHKSTYTRISPPINTTPDLPMNCSRKTLFAIRGWESAVGTMKIPISIRGCQICRRGNPWVRNQMQSANSRVGNGRRITNCAEGAPHRPVAQGPTVYSVGMSVRRKQ